MSLATIKQKLAELPNTPDEIAAFLTKHGITGRRGSCYRCPFANYLGHGVAVKPDKIILNIDTDQYMAVPEPVSEFIGRFDQGNYPELVEEPIHIP
jgi:hypothetical protein